MTLKWFISRRVRHANAMCRHVRKLINHQRDVLAQKDIEEVQAAIQGVKAALAANADKAALDKELENLEKTANKRLKPYPNPVLRENIEVLLVALAVAMAVRTFFLQPFKIPTGSMQPTLFGVISSNLPGDFEIPTGLSRFKEWLQGFSYVHIVADRDGMLEKVSKPVRVLIFNVYQSVQFAGKTYSIWFPPDYGNSTLTARANLREGQMYRKGEDIVKLQVRAGDHLFVNRLTYNFRQPRRGEIIVFETRGIPELSRREPEDTFYIKRLCGLSGETLTMVQDYTVIATTMRGDGFNPTVTGATPVGRLVVNGQPLTASTPHFENVYSFYGASRGGVRELPYVEHQYFGHALVGYLAPGHSFHVGTNKLFVLGDNTLNSSDSRFWGDFPQEKVIGKSFFVYWPITGRFGWGQQ